MLDVALLVAALLYGLSGSLHCVAMCGPLAMVASTPSKRLSLPIIGNAALQRPGQPNRYGISAAALLYQGARFAGYAGIGAAFGMIGRALDLSFGVTVSTLLPYLMVTLLTASLFAPRFRLPALPKWAWRLPRRGTVVLPLAIGGFTALIPCGLLYGAAPLAAGSGSALGGALVMVAFALGTAPGLLFLTALPARFTPMMRALKPWLTAAAIAMVLARTWWLQPKVDAAGNQMICHPGGTVAAKQ